MRRRWRRLTPAPELDEARLARLVGRALGVRVRGVRRIHRGLVNANFDVALHDPPGRVLLRLYQGGIAPARKEAALAAMLDGHAPVAPVLHGGDSNEEIGHPWVVLGWVEGLDLDVALARAGETGRVELGHAVGAALAGVHAIRFAHPAFLSPELCPESPIAFDGMALSAFLRNCLCDGPAGARLGADLTARLLAFAAREGGRLNAWGAEARLAHGDFNPSNIRVRRLKGRWHVAAILDWEFALSATPALDFGALLRPPLDSCNPFGRGLEAGYRAGGGMLPADWQGLARIADLFAWADMLRGRPDDPGLRADARRSIEATLAMG